MECNKDEAIIAKEMAEKKFLEGDFQGAKRMASKAHSLFPGLDGLSQFIEIIHIHIASSHKIQDAPDYYGILGVDSSADDDTLRRQYRRMALTLHPDKNKSVGADGAFQILSEAWSVLSEKESRNAYNLRISVLPRSQSGSVASTRTPYTTFSTSIRHGQTSPWSTASPQYGFPAVLLINPQYMSYGVPFTQGFFAGFLNPIFQGNRAYYYQNPSQRSWNYGFTAVPYSMYPPVGMHNPVQPQMSSTIATAADFFSSHSAAHYGNAPNTAQSRSTANQQRPDSFLSSCSWCKTHYVCRNVYLNEFLECPQCKKVFRAMQIPAPNIKARGSRYWNLYRHTEDLSTFLNRWRSVPSSVPENCRDIPPGIVEPTTTPSSSSRNPLMEEPMKNLDGDCSTSTEGAGTKPGLCSQNLGKPESLIGADVQKGESVTFQACSVKVNVNNPGPAKNKQPTKSHTKGLSHMEVKMERKELVRQFKKLDIEKNSSKKFHNEDPEKRSGGTFSDLNAKAHDVEACLDETLSMSVPDANFHNFDNERVESSFSNNQVWAAYDDDDGMPRYYALVHNLISRSPFQLEICWLKSKSTTEFGSFEWISSGFTKTIGNFWVGKPIKISRLNSFSHPMRSKKGPRGVIHIFPAKGDVWAVYHNWSFEWNFDTEKDVIHKYQVVEVHGDYSEDRGVSVIPLVKVAGFTTLFRRMPDHNVVWTIPKEEMFRFSHQVPMFKLDGMKGKGAPEGCYELDPAALPPELLEIITEAEATEATTQRVSEHRGHARRMDPKITEVFGKGN
ncbi:uncharacterized protein LOC127254039 [Andrographis paniculata]|uniref:uncharacterized protein LOC127254039 n=1 Tax=Andrographis paniculata TaxID=175694 RepID=UPI0021E98DB8|nr:uncharacterized protein LOC127254039 [Andrographis paniculata]